MQPTARRTLRISVLVAAITLPLALAFLASAQQPSPAAKAKTTEEVFKNIKSLKGKPASELIPTMEFMANSLGVKCEFCHDMKAFDKDTKDEKRTAREMIAMQEGINRGHFKGKREVTCNTCHHGQQHPAAVPTLAELSAPIPEPAHEHGAHHPPQLASPTLYLDQFYTAAGGEAALARLTSRTLRGEVTYSEGPQLSFESFARASGPRAESISLKDGPARSISSGHSGYLTYPGRPTRRMSSGEVEAERVETDFEFPSNFKQRYTQFRPGIPEQISGKPVNVLIASRPGEPPVRLYFDQASHLLVRLIYYVETPLGRNPTQIDISRYSESSGLQLPAQWVVTRPDSRATYVVASADNQSPIDESRFSPPSEVAH
jgi:hypothetical protein